MNRIVEVAGNCVYSLTQQSASVLQLICCANDLGRLIGIQRRGKATVMCQQKESSLVKFSLLRIFRGSVHNPTLVS